MSWYPEEVLMSGPGSTTHLEKEGLEEGHWNNIKLRTMDQAHPRPVVAGTEIYMWAQNPFAQEIKSTRDSIKMEGGIQPLSKASMFHPTRKKCYSLSALMMAK